MPAYLLMLLLLVSPLTHPLSSLAQRGEFTGYLLTEESLTEPSVEFINLTRYHTLIYRKDGIIAHIRLPTIKAVERLGDNFLRVTKRNGEVFAAEIYNPSADHCMLFRFPRAEGKMDVRALQYKIPDRNGPVEIPVCDVRKIAFD